MNPEKETEFFISLDRRVSEHDSKISNIQRDYTELSHEIKELLNRINNGVSPSVNEVRKENGEIKLSISDMSHKLDLNMIEMKSVVRESAEHTRLMIDNFDKHRLAPTMKNFDENRLTPVEKEVGFIKKTFIYGLVGALIVFLGQKGINVVWDKVFDRSPVATSQ